MIGAKQNYTHLAHQLQIQFTDKCGVLCGWLEENRTCAAVTLKLYLPVVGHYVMTCHKFTYNNGTQSVLPHRLVDLNKNSIIPTGFNMQNQHFKMWHKHSFLSIETFHVYSLHVTMRYSVDLRVFFCLYFTMIFPYSSSVSRHSFLSVCKVLVYQKFFRFFDTLWWFYTLQPKCLFSHGCQSFHVWIWTAMMICMWLISLILNVTLWLNILDLIILHCYVLIKLILSYSISIFILYVYARYMGW